MTATVATESVVEFVSHEPNEAIGAEDRLVVALAGGATVVEAARVAGVGERTVYRRMGEAGFRGRVNAARAAIVEHAVGRMAGSMTAAADTLRGLLSAEREATRLGAARSILELGPRLREAAELERRITDLETTAARRIEELEDRLREGAEFGRREGREVGRHEGGSWPRG